VTIPTTCFAKYSCLLALNTTNWLPKEQWTFSEIYLDPATDLTPAVSFDGSAVYVWAYNSYGSDSRIVLTNLRSIDGSTLWQSLLGYIGGAPIVCRDGVLLVPTSDGILFALDGETGIVLWKVPLPGAPWVRGAFAGGSLVAGSDGMLFYSGGSINPSGLASLWILRSSLVPRLYFRGFPRSCQQWYERFARLSLRLKESSTALLPTTLYVNSDASAPFRAICLVNATAGTALDYLDTGLLEKNTLNNFLRNFNVDFSTHGRGRATSITEWHPAVQIDTSAMLINPCSGLALEVGADSSFVFSTALTSRGIASEVHSVSHWLNGTRRRQSRRARVSVVDAFSQPQTVFGSASMSAAVSDAQSSSLTQWSISDVSLSGRFSAQSLQFHNNRFRAHGPATSLAYVLASADQARLRLYVTVAPTLSSINYARLGTVYFLDSSVNESSADIAVANACQLIGVEMHECGRHQVFHAAIGLCVCSGCWTGVSCTERVSCCGHGQCDDVSGLCSCIGPGNGPPIAEALWSTNVPSIHDQCASDCPSLPTGELCSGHGSCRCDGCACDVGWSGLACDVLCTQSCPGDCHEEMEFGSCDQCTGTCSCNAAVGCGTECYPVVTLCGPDLICAGSAACCHMDNSYFCVTDCMDCSSVLPITNITLEVTTHRRVFGNCTLDACCPVGFAGSDCSVPICPGVPQCSGHGSCASTTLTAPSQLTCKCDELWSGVDCSIPLCAVALTTTPCGDEHCLSGEVCCTVGNARFCRSDCDRCSIHAHVVNAATNETQRTRIHGNCSLGCEGGACSQDAACFSSPPCSGHGSCNFLSEFAGMDVACSCNVGWEGDSCAAETAIIAVSTQRCGDDLVCYGTDACCHFEATLDNRAPVDHCLHDCTSCSMIVLVVVPDSPGIFSVVDGICTAMPQPCPGSTPCSQHGVCDVISSSIPFCRCSANWTGTACNVSLVTVPAVDHASEVCGPTGVCDGLGAHSPSCICDLDYGGPQCDIPRCLAPCQHGGLCSSPNACACSDGWMGSDCSVPSLSSVCGCTEGAGVCPPLGWVDPNPLNPTTCVCKPGYGGTNCSVPCACNTDHTINGSAWCTNSLQCACTSSYSGSSCA
jgi:hypothetical protein